MKLTKNQIAALRDYAKAGPSGISGRDSIWSALTNWSLVKRGLLQEHRNQTIWRLHSITDAGLATISKIDTP
jgi:hypothetical protein